MIQARMDRKRVGPNVDVANRILQEAYDELKNQKPLQALERSVGLTKACRDHAMDQSINGGWGHTGKDGSSAGTRMNRYGTWKGMSGENMAYSKKNATEIITGLYIDSVSSTRGHRKNMMNPSYTKVGIFASGPENVKKA